MGVSDAQQVARLGRCPNSITHGVKVATLARYKLPEPDVIIGATGRGTMGWLPETVDAWNAARPGWHGPRTGE